MPGFFICYRRDDAAGYAGRIYDWLVGAFGPDSVFMDVDACIFPGEDFVRRIEAKISSADVMLVVIGRNWLVAVDKQRHHRLEDPGDHVRREILQAFDDNVRVIPVLVDGVPMPSDDDLPAVLARLSRCNAWTLSPGHFPEQMKQLLDMLEKEKAEAKRRESERQKREAEERRALILAERDAARSATALKPHNYPLWVLLFCAAILMSAFLSVSTVPGYMETVGKLKYAKAAYGKQDYPRAITLAEDVLKSAPTSREAKLTLAKSCFQLGDPHHLRKGLNALQGALPISNLEWLEIEPLLPPAYRALFEQKKE
jgi:hypothetical protein